MWAWGGWGGVGGELAGEEGLGCFVGLEKGLGVLG